MKKAIKVVSTMWKDAQPTVKKIGDEVVKAISYPTGTAGAMYHAVKIAERWNQESEEIQQSSVEKNETPTPKIH